MSSSNRKQSFPYGDNNSPNGDDQVSERKFHEFSERLQSAAKDKGFQQSSLAKALGITRGTLNRYWNGDRLPPADTLVDLTDALHVSAKWLVKGATDLAPRDATLSDWIEIAEYDLRQLDDHGKGDPIGWTPFRKDWLNRMFGLTSGLWLTKLPASYTQLELQEGELVFLRDLQPGDAQDGALYIVRRHGLLGVARLDMMANETYDAPLGGVNERRLSFRDVGHEDEKAILVARIMGAPLRRL